LALKYLTWCALRWCKISKLHSWKFLHHGRSKFAIPAGHNGKNFSFHLRCYNLTIRVVNFCETFWTCSCSSLGQDLTVKSAKKWKINSVGLLELETAVLECFLEKTPLSPLGVKSNFVASKYKSCSKLGIKFHFLL
jgi:hypothetical protein